MGKIMKKGLALVLALSMVTGLTACGGKDVASGDVKYYRAQYQDSLPESFKGLNGTPMISGDTIVYAANTNEWRTYGIYAYNLTTGETRTYFEKTEPEVYDPYAGGMSVENYTVDADGNVYLYAYTWTVDTSNIKTWTDATFEDVIDFMTEAWQYSEDMAITEWNEYLEKNYIDQGYVDAEGNVDYNRVLNEMESWNLQHEYTYSLVKYDTQGNEVYTSEMQQNNGEDGSSSYLMSMIAGKDGMLFTYENRYSNNSDEYIVSVYDANGTKKGECKLDNYGNNLILMPDGNVAALAWDMEGSGQILSIIDANTLQVTSDIKFQDIYIERLVALDAENFLLSSNGTLYKYNTTTQTKERFLNWVDCDIQSSSVRGFQLMEDGRLLVATQTYDYMTYESISELALVEEIPAEEAANIKSITLACINTDEQLEQRVIKSNKKNPETRIRIKTFWEEIGEEDYEDAMARFVTNMASDPDVDVVYFNGYTPYADMMNFASKGLLIDLNTYLESDAEVKRDDLMASILNACTYNNMLVGLPTGFSVSTVIGKASDVGTKPGWTFDDMKALLESKEPGTQLFYGRTREWALQMCMNLGYKQFVDMENATCTFDTQEFVDVLEFANLFPEEFDWNTAEDETILMNQGKVLLSAYNLTDFAEIQLYTEIFGDKLTYIGYPTIEGNGALMTMGSTFAVTKNCEMPEHAWKLIREYFLPVEEDANSQGYYSYNLSIRNDEFDKFCKNAMSDDNNGSWGWGDFEVEIKPATQEQVDEVKDLIANITAVDGAVSSAMLNIINEEAAAFFNGQKSAQEVASIIQSRMQVYLSETN